MTTATTIDLDATMAALDAVGVPGNLIHTGGGVHVLYAGHAHTAEPGWTRYAAACGPLYAEGDALVFVTDDAYLGLDDGGDTDPLTLAAVGATTPEHVAALLAAQVALVPSGIVGARRLSTEEARATIA
jgi:hypothetical protein